MKTLKDAIRGILLETPRFAIAKEGYEIDDDYISIIDFLKKNTDFTEKVNIKNQKHMEELVIDKSILKRYFSSEIPDNLKYLALMALGIEWLYYTCQMEDINESKEILYKKINEEKKLWIERRLAND